MFVVGISYAGPKHISGKFTDNNNYPLTAATAPFEKKYSSPEETWRHFKNALMNGNYKSAKDCYYNSSKNSIYKFKKIGHSKTKQLIQQIKSFNKISQDSDKAKYLVVRDMRGVAFSTYVYFARINNEWKIEKY